MPPPPNTNQFDRTPHGGASSGIDYTLVFNIIFIVASECMYNYALLELSSTLLCD